MHAHQVSYPCMLPQSRSEEKVPAAIFFVVQVAIRSLLGPLFTCKVTQTIVFSSLRTVARLIHEALAWSARGSTEEIY